MKWVKTGDEIKRYLEKAPPEARGRIANLFYSSDGKKIILDEYATYKDADKFHRWGYEVELPASYELNHSALHEYETYAGGWIDFWDTQVRQESTDHALIFKLRICDGKRYMDAYILNIKKVDKLNVYVNVANPPTSTDPPPPPPGRPW
jgi:hypothetical protein